MLLNNAAVYLDNDLLKEVKVGDTSVSKLTFQAGGRFGQVVELKFSTEQELHIIDVEIMSNGKFVCILNPFLNLNITDFRYVPGV